MSHNPLLPEKACATELLQIFGKTCIILVLRFDKLIWLDAAWVLIFPCCTNTALILKVKGTIPVVSIFAERNRNTRRP